MLSHIDERPDLGEWVVVGYQCDVVPNRADYNGMLYEERGRRILAHTGERVIIDAAGQPWGAGTFPVKDFKAGEWHDFRVLARGNHHQHWIDGHQTVDVIDLDEKGRKLEGILGMQVHVGPPMKIEFKDLFLKKLKKAEREASPDNVERLVEYLDCMPLAVPQAAAYIEQAAPRMTVHKYIKILETDDSERAALLQKDVRDPRRDRQASNSIIMTWHVAFTHLRQTRDSAARLLALMSLIRPGGDPRPPASGAVRGGWGWAERL